MIRKTPAPIRALFPSLSSLLVLLAILKPLAGFGATEIPDLGSLDISSIVPQAAADEIVKTLSVLTKHRPYSGASALGSGADFGIEASLVHLPSTFGPTLADLGMGGGAELADGSLPMTKVHLHKALGPKADVGISGIYYPGNLIWGIDLKFVLVQPEEGPMWSFRLGYSETDLDLSRFGISGLPIQVAGVEVGQGNLKMSTRSITPELLFSKRLEFAEPYLGAGIEFNSGQIEVPLQINILPTEQVLRTAPSRSQQVVLFSGLSFHVPHLGFHLTLEGAWGSLGMHRLGTVVGFGF